jgi:hypothetical protein
VVPDRALLNQDIEAASVSAIVQPDPFMFRDALMDDAQLAQLRRRNRKNGKALEKYHRRQNNVISSVL